MKCKKCGNVVTERDNFCNRCGAKVERVKRVEKDDEAQRCLRRWGIALIIGALLYGVLFVAFFAAFVFMPILTIPIVVVGVVYAYFLYWMFKKDSGFVPNKQNIEKCNRCGSTNLKLYRKGYDYKPGFWGAIFGVKGAGYAGGFEANDTCCLCKDCGYKWQTDFDYRTIDK